MEKKQNICFQVLFFKKVFRILDVDMKQYIQIYIYTKIVDKLNDLDLVVGYIFRIFEYNS